MTFTSQLFGCLMVTMLIECTNKTKNSIDKHRVNMLDNEEAVDDLDMSESL